MNSNFSNNLKATRLAQGFSQQQMADELGISRSAYAGYEINRRSPSIENTRIYRRSPPCFGCLLIICSGTDRLTLPI